MHPHTLEPFDFNLTTCSAFPLNQIRALDLINGPDRSSIGPCAPVAHSAQSCFLLILHPLFTVYTPFASHFLFPIFMHFNFSCIYFFLLHFIILCLLDYFSQKKMFIRLFCIFIIYLFIHVYFSSFIFIA